MSPVIKKIGIHPELKYWQEIPPSNIVIAEMNKNTEVDERDTQRRRIFLFTGAKVGTTEANSSKSTFF